MRGGGGGLKEMGLTQAGIQYIHWGESDSILSRMRCKR